MSRAVSNPWETTTLPAGSARYCCWATRAVFRGSIGVFRVEVISIQRTTSPWLKAATVAPWVAVPALMAHNPKTGIRDTGDRGQMPVGDTVSGVAQVLGVLVQGLEMDVGQGG